MEDSEPGVTTSVLIVSYNCEPALRRCLTALEASEQRETFEILVVDKGSLDGSGQLDGEFPNVTILRLPRNFGRTKARNIGTRTAKGEFLFLLEPDVEVSPGAVSQLTAALAAEAGAVAVCPLLVDDEGRPISRAACLPGPKALYRAWAEGKPWMDMVAGPLPEEASLSPVMESSGTAGDEDGEPSALAGKIPVECPEPAAVLVRTGFVKGMSYFDERYGEFGSDLDLFTQAHRAAKKIYVLPAVRALWRAAEGMWTPSHPPARTLVAADYGIGAVTYVGKHYGWAAGLKLRVRMLLRALGRMQLGLFVHLLSGHKIDGSQQEL